MEQIILDTIKECLEITDNSSDNKLKRSIKKSLASIRNIIWCDDIFLKDNNDVVITRTDSVRICELYTTCNPVHRLCLPISRIVSIWWSEDLTNVVTKWNYVWLKQNSCSCQCCSCVDIVWEGWFETLPDDLMSYIIDESNSAICGDKTIKKYQYLDKTIEYCCDLDYKSKEQQVSALMKKYYNHFTFTPCRCQ